MIGHFSAEELASYRAGTVSESKAAKISVHLLGCARCTGVEADLAGVSLLLASIPTPPMPDRLAERLRSALAAEAAARAALSVAMQAPADGALAASGAAPVHTPGRPDLPARARRRPRRWRMPNWSSPLVLRAMAGTAALVLVVAGGLLLAKTGGRGVPSSAARSASRPTAHGAAQPASAGSPVAARVPYQHGGQLAYANLVTSDANYTKSSLPAGVRQQVASHPTMASGTAPESPMNHPAGSGGASPQPSAAHPKNLRIDQLGACISAVAGGRLVQLADEARYSGVPVVIIILQPQQGAFDVIVVGQACGSSGQDVIARLAVPQK